MDQTRKGPARFADRKRGASDIFHPRNIDPSDRVGKIVNIGVVADLVLHRLADSDQRSAA